MLIRLLCAGALIALACAASADEAQQGPDPMVILNCRPIAPPIDGPSTDIGDPILPVNRV